MKLALVITKHDDVFINLRQYLGQDWHTERANIERLHSDNQTIHNGIIFLDIDILKHGKTTGAAKIGEEVKYIRSKVGNIPLVVMSSSDKVADAIKAVKNGANSYLTYPVQPTELKHVLDSVRILSNEGTPKQSGEIFWKVTVFHLVKTESPLMQRVFDDIQRVAPTDATVLLTGETGTGKNMLAKLIHEHSHRADKPFIPVHCGAIPETLIESEFFGHEKGAFTGAMRKKLGKFEIANGGTIFLDEIGTITLPVQIKLLQVLQEGVFYRVGGDNPLHTDVRIIAAANVDLKSLVEKGCFRQDLFYRLNVFPIFVPPLRERKEDIPLLVEIILEKLNRRHHRNIKAVSTEVMEAFMRYNWPGNIRELENVMERAYILESQDILTSINFPSDIMGSTKKCHEPFLNIFSVLNSENEPFPGISEFRKMVVDHAERMYLSKLLKLHGGRINLSAKAAGITTRQLRKLMLKHNIKKDQFKRSLCNKDTEKAPEEV